MSNCFRIQTFLVILACTCLFSLVFSVPASAASPEIRVFAKTTEGSQLSEVANGDVLPSGTLVRFQITAGRAGPLIVTLDPPEGKRKVLGQLPSVEAGKRIMLPSATGWYALDENTGVERILVRQGGMRKIPLMSLRQILPVDHSCVHYCELKALEICNILNHKGVTKKKCIDRSFDLCLSMIRYGDC
ncbi:MAG: hypothetical protein V3S54_05740 [Woeseiaceae bacterium]|jgi:hypothetical protein